MKIVKTHIIRILFLSLLFVSPLMLTSYDDSKNFELAKNLDIFYSLFQELNTHYVDDIDAGELMSYAIDQMLESLDPYTNYIPESDVERFQMMTKGEYGGVGALIGRRDSCMMISEIFEGYPAHKAGLLPGDKIVKVDDRTIKGISQNDIHELLQGQPGTNLKLGIVRGGKKEIQTIIVKRENISMKSVPYYGIMDGNIGYVKLVGFTQNCSVELKNACIDLKSKGAKSIILDLRDNPGGLLVEAIQITNLFVEQNKKIVFTKGKNSISESTFFTKEAPWDTKIPLVVLVNENSASASEIVSGALQDLDRAVVIGKQTYGKGLVQTRRELAHNALLKVTTSKYYIPSGRCIQKMDYSKHLLRGKGEAMPDSLQRVFYTENKRPVKDGGGIVPDVKVSVDSISEFLQALFEKYIIEDYVNSNYSFADSTHISPQTFHITDAEYQKFIQYAKSNGFVFTSKSEELLILAKEEMENENIPISKEMKELEYSINSQQLTLFETNKKEIVYALESVIIQRIFFEKGKIKFQMYHDDVVDEAVKYLKNMSMYTNIIEGKTGIHKKL